MYFPEGLENTPFKLRIVFWNIFILEVWRFKKRIALSEKNPTLPKRGLI